MAPLLSIVIPTRNRQNYCIAAIENILSYDYPDMELCIQDNSDNDELEQYIQNRLPDSRLIYKRIPEQIASIFNIGGSLGLATGKYVIMIGDDDTVLPNIFEVVEWMNKNNIDSLNPIPIINYYWPGAHPFHTEGYIVVPNQSYKFCKVNNVNEKLKLLFEKGTIRYLQYNLPKVYHGIVKREFLEKIKEKTTYYVGGLSPDIYLSVAISSLVNNHYTSDFSVSIAGACPKSSTSQDLNKGHRGLLEDAPHLNLRGNYNWDNLVPNYYSIDTIWGESALKAVEEMEIPQLRKSFNFNYMAAYALLYNRSIFDIAFTHTFNKWSGVNRLKKIIIVGMNGIYILISYFFSRFKRIFNKQEPEFFFDNVKDISAAVKIISKNTL